MDDWRKKLSALKSIVIRFKVERREECSKELEANLEVFSVLKDLATQCAGWQPEILKKFVRGVSVQTHTHTHTAHYTHYTQSCVCVGAAVSTALACVEIFLWTIEHANSHSKTSMQRFARHGLRQAYKTLSKAEFLHQNFSMPNTFHDCVGMYVLTTFH